MVLRKRPLVTVAFFMPFNLISIIETHQPFNNNLRAEKETLERCR